MSEKKAPSEIFVLQCHARILRETLAKVMKMGNPIIQKYCDGGLKQYAAAVRAYCEHTELSYVAKEEMNACLDCGVRLPLEQSK